MFVLPPDGLLLLLHPLRFFPSWCRFCTTTLDQTTNYCLSAVAFSLSLSTPSLQTSQQSRFSSFSVIQRRLCNTTLDQTINYCLLLLLLLHSLCLSHHTVQVSRLHKTMPGFFFPSWRRPFCPSWHRFCATSLKSNYKLLFAIAFSLSLFTQSLQIIIHLLADWRKHNIIYSTRRIDKNGSMMTMMISSRKQQQQQHDVQHPEQKTEERLKSSREEVANVFAKLFCRNPHGTSSSITLMLQTTTAKEDPSNCFFFFFFCKEALWLTHHHKKSIGTLDMPKRESWWGGGLAIVTAVETAEATLKSWHSFAWWAPHSFPLHNDFHQQRASDL